MLVKKHAGKGGGRELGVEDRSPAEQRCARTVPPCAALTALLSVVAVMSCLYLGVKTNDLQARIDLTSHIIYIYLFILLD